MSTVTEQEVTYQDVVQEMLQELRRIVSNPQVPKDEVLNLALALKALRDS